MTSRRALDRTGVPHAVAVRSHDLHDYRSMFALAEADLQAGPILDVGGAAGTFGAQLRSRGGQVVALDPLYGLPGAALLDAVRRTARQEAATALRQPELFRPLIARDPEKFVSTWTDNAHWFVVDYRPGGRNYRLPHDGLDVPAGHFALTLVNHFVHERPDAPEGDELVEFLLRLVHVTHGEVRIFPVVEGPVLTSLVEGLVRRDVVTTLEKSRDRHRRRAVSMLVVTS
ncbi:hypothetical protein [Lentzea albida]|uniref:Methyltransferase domain-containing protein n=1 Tax=Lentzea albida TaxID=65499 RepID=A0A1H9WSU6_9PSEU|nr:hypothetical protein [Lentzea albida]SES37006.1 hypothetical protein SAMN04488000_12485 [Lentzea albida]